MRKLFFISMIVAFFGFSACGQNEKVPTKVKTSFTQKFPDAKKIKWDKENKTEWEAEFKMNGKEYSTNFDNDGNWKETEYEIKESAIPAAVQKTLNKEFSGYKIEEAEISETANGKVYEFQMEKGDADMEVAISPAGKIVTKKEIKKGDEDND